MNQIEKSFVEASFLEAKAENGIDGGLLFPFLVTRKWKIQRIIRAIVIPAKKNTTACFACLGYSGKYNGVFFSINPEEDDKEKEIVEIVYYRIEAEIDIVKNEDRWFIKTAPNKKALEEFFEEKQAIYVSNKDGLETCDISL